MYLSLRSLTLTVLIAASTRLPAPESYIAANPNTVRVYLLADSLHTGLAFDLRWLEKWGYIKPAEIGDHEFVAMSWGNEVAYVQERWLTPGQVLRALFTPSPSVMECIPFDWKVEEVCLHQRVYVAEVPASSGATLAGFLNAHTALSRDGTPVTIAPSSWGDGRLIRCPRHIPYDIFRMCNNWTAEALAATGLSTDTKRVLTAVDVIDQATSQANGFRLIWNPSQPQFPGFGGFATEPESRSHSPSRFGRGTCR